MGHGQRVWGRMRPVLTFLASVLFVGALVACRRGGTAPSPAAGGASPAPVATEGSAAAAIPTGADASATDPNAPGPDASAPDPDAPGPDASAPDPDAPDRDGFYYDLDGVVLYLEAYGELPPNYVTKGEARAAGWEGGTPSQVFDGAAIGGDRFGNYEGLLPDLPRGAQYRECDLDTGGRSSRGAHRLIYTDDGDPTDGCGPYYYTEDHYDSFCEVAVVDGEVVSVG